MSEATMTRPPREFSLQTVNGGPPLDGEASALAGVAEPGDRLTVGGLGVFVNVGTKESPTWEKWEG